MEKITDKIAALQPGSVYVSLEFFPPKTSMGSANLQARLERMSRGLRPLFVNVTWGAGGSTASKSLELAEICQRQLGLTTCLHMTCTNMNRQLIDDALVEAKALGIRNILALRGDPPRNDDYSSFDLRQVPEPAEMDFKWAIDLVKHIRKEYGDYFCIGVAAYPEGHADQNIPPIQDPVIDIPYLAEKVKAGADFIMTQLFFDVEKYLRFEDLLRSDPSGTFSSIPIIPGLMPIQSYQILKRTTKLSHASVPATVEQRLNSVKNDDQAVKEVSIEIVAGMIQKIRSRPSPGPRGFHFYTLNLEKAVAFILERCNLIPPPSPPLLGDKLISLNDCAVEDGIMPVSTSLPENSVTPLIGNLVINRRASSSSSAHNTVIASGILRPESPHHISEQDAGHLTSVPPLRSTTLAISEGEGSLGREATWDDYPNGRWGDARSPAYGEIDGYGPALHVSSTRAAQLWGSPKSDADISTLFANYVRGTVEELPWSEGEDGMREESTAITQELVKLNEKGFWTVASQPAINCAASSDSVFGWGPDGGFVFQKAFVEFFAAAEKATTLLDLLRRQGKGGGVSYFAASPDGSFETSDPKAINAVTWGVFPGKEIVTPTIIEAVSFRAWAEEAFVKWEDWSRCYPSGGEAAKYLKANGRGVWLFNVVCHDYVDKQRLWEVLGVA